MAFPIGYKFRRRGTVRKDVNTIMDIHRTYNNQGDLVKIEYVCEHLFLGQAVRSKYLHTTIAMSEPVE